MLEQEAFKNNKQMLTLQLRQLLFQASVKIWRDEEQFSLVQQQCNSSRTKKATNTGNPEDSRTQGEWAEAWERVVTGENSKWGKIVRGKFVKLFLVIPQIGDEEHT